MEKGSVVAVNLELITNNDSIDADAQGYREASWGESSLSKHSSRIINTTYIIRVPVSRHHRTPSLDVYISVQAHSVHTRSKCIDIHRRAQH